MATRRRHALQPRHPRLRHPPEGPAKLPKVIIVACMRKLLSLINAMVRDGLTWDQLDVVKKLANKPLTFNTVAPW